MDELKRLHSEETERASLGCMFLDREAADLGKTLLVPDDFYTPLYRVIFQAMQKLEEIDIYTVSNELQRMGEWERVGLEWLANISTSVATSIYMRKYIENLKHLSYLRRVVREASEMTQAAYRQDVAGIDKSMEAIRGDGYGTAKIATLAEATEKHIKKIAELRASGKKIVGLPTGFEDLDLMLGGLRNGEMTILAARPSMGKSALMLDIAKNAQKSLTEKNDRVVIFSLEMPDDSLGNRGYTSEYLIDNDRFAVGTNDSTWMDTLEEVAKNSEHYEQGAGRLLIDDRSGQTPESMNAYCHGVHQQGFNIRLICIDYLQLIQGNGKERVQEVADISRRLKQMAKDWGCPVLALSQLSRACEQRADHRPILSDLRDSGAIEQDADTITFLYRDEYYFPDSEKKGQAELIIAKQRNGPTGTIDLVWMPRSTTFRSVERFHKTKEKPPKEWEQQTL